MTDVLQRAARGIQRTYSAASGDDRPLGGYLAVLGAYAGVVGGASVLARLLGREPPERIAPSDVVLLAVATHKMSRLLTKDAVTSPLRAPFTRYQKPTGEAEVAEEVRDENQVQH